MGAQKSKYVKWFGPACWQQRCKKQTDASQVDSADRKQRADFGLDKKEAWRSPGEGQYWGDKGRALDRVIPKRRWRHESGASKRRAGKFKLVSCH